MSEYKQLLMEADIIPLDDEAKNYLELTEWLYGFQVWL